MSTVPILNFQAFITAEGDELATDSRKVAEVFGKRHADVMRAVVKLSSDLPAEERERNFALTFFSVLGPNGATRQDPGYTITRDGFTLLAMSFTGKKALMFKLAYIKAFNGMAAFIKNQREGIQFQYLRKELEYKGRKGSVSQSAREMRAWRDEKPARLSEMGDLLTSMQPTLLPN